MESIIQPCEDERRVKELIASEHQLSGMSAMLKLDVVSYDAEKKQIVTRHTTGEWADNIHGTTHGGIIAAVLDTSMGILCRCQIYPRWSPTINLNINYIQSVKRGSQLYVKAELLRCSRNLIWARAVAWVATPEKPCASAEGTFYISKEQMP